MDRLARMQLAVEMCPSSMSATGRLRVLDCGEKIVHVPACRGRGVKLDDPFRSRPRDIARVRRRNRKWIGLAFAVRNRNPQRMVLALSVPLSP